MKQYSLTVILLVVLLSGCDKDIITTDVPLPPPPQMTGTWSGGVVFLFRVNILEHNASITGTGMFNGQLGAYLTGSTGYPNVTFFISAPGFESAVFNGRYFHADSIKGTLNGSGFIDAPLILGRE